MLTLFREQPRALSMIFMLEIWERFGFYTVQGILTLYFIRSLGLSETQAYFTFGAFSALVYGMICLGGYLGDKVLGPKRTIILGLSVLALGYLFLALANQDQVYLALGLICVGNGLFKANPSNLLSKCYEENDPRLHGGFTLYYMAVNLGSIVALFIGPTLSNQFGPASAYFLSFIGLVVGLFNYWAQRRSIANVHFPMDKAKISSLQWTSIVITIIGLMFVSAYLLQHVMMAKNLVWLVAVSMVIFYFFQMSRESGLASRKMLVAFILMLEAVLFFTLYQQMPTSLTLFAVNNVHAFLFGIKIDPQSFQALNPIWIIVLSPILVYAYKSLEQRGFSFSMPHKFAVGMLCCGLSFGLLYFARFSHDAAGMVSSWWLVASYFFQSLGELLVSALGVAMIAELVPGAIAGFVMGIWFLASGVAGFIGASVASYTALPENLPPGIESLMLYTQVFAYIGLITLLIGIIMWFTSARLTTYMQEKQTEKTGHSKWKKDHCANEADCYVM